ncbi:MAG: hypothetical protein GQF41_4195 [Candidatus Rifleibacterium amylolyticum]|nr:MAG: hypothetical protein GQF41_4195 [Candidatus Rifleibacterium amylolyticum]
MAQNSVALLNRLISNQAVCAGLSPFSDGSYCRQAIRAM